MVIFHSYVAVYQRVAGPGRVNYQCLCWQGKSRKQKKGAGTAGAKWHPILFLGGFGLSLSECPYGWVSNYACANGGNLHHFHKLGGIAHFQTHR